MSPFDKLKKDFPVFTIKNKSMTAKHIALANGEDIQVQPGATVDITSANMIQLPDLSSFKCVNPSTSKLISYGIIKSNKPAAEPATKSEPETVKTDKNDKYNK